MPPVTIALVVQILQACAKYGPDAVAGARKIIAAIRANGAPLTAEDIALLDSYDKTAADYLAEAGGPPPV